MSETPEQDPKKEPQTEEMKAYRGGWAEDFLVALMFLTRLPLRPSFHFDMKSLGKASRAFPLVGVITGGLAGTLFLLCYLAGLPPLVSALLALGSQVLLTGALHEDAIGDVADGFGGGADREKKLAIMRDSRVGSYAVVALILLIGIKAATIASFSDPIGIFAILITAAAISRGMMVWVMYLLPPARVDGLGHGAGQPELNALLLATLVMILIAIVALGPMDGAVALFAGILGAGAMGLIARRQIGGQTGDVLGAAQQISEVFILLALLIVRG
ncbi:MAG: adenosylcobinamide-GDP ribazoletransferase [Alphaproteobacteria bacterium]|nr:MAG: adenosylcobinamide-GDP ribazoletransferase [Alphaproteobacteria bacterium]